MEVTSTLTLDQFVSVLARLRGKAEVNERGQSAIALAMWDIQKMMVLS